MSALEIYKRLSELQTNAGLQPDPAWVKRQREILMMQVGNSMSKKSGGWLALLLRQLRQSVVPRVVSLVRGPAMAVLSVIGLFAGGSFMGVSASNKSVPGDVLYTVKLATEQTRLVLTAGKKEKLILKTEFVARRAEEIKTLADSNVSQKPMRIQVAAEGLKRDLDTVKRQLNEVSTDETPLVAAQAAKLVDQKSSELMRTLKVVKYAMSDEDARRTVNEAQAAAVNTGVQAVQILISSGAKPEAQVDKPELIASINDKVQGMQANLDDAAQRFMAGGAVATSTVGTSGVIITKAESDAQTSSTLIQLKGAKDTLAEARVLLTEDKLAEVADKLVETAKTVAKIEANTLAIPLNSTSTQTTAPHESATTGSTTTVQQ